MRSMKPLLFFAIDRSCTNCPGRGAWPRFGKRNRARRGQAKSTRTRGGEGVRRSAAKSKTEFNVQLSYAAVVVDMGEDGLRVADIVSRDKAVCTQIKLCPGMTLQAPRQQYGAPLIPQREYGTFLEYYAKGHACWLQMCEAQNVITSIGIDCQP